jgi:hypothetical protein
MNQEVLRYENNQERNEWWNRCKNIKGNDIIMYKGCILNVYIGQVYIYHPTGRQNIRRPRSRLAQQFFMLKRVTIQFLNRLKKKNNLWHELNLLISVPLSTRMHLLCVQSLRAVTSEAKELFSYSTIRRNGVPSSEPTGNHHHTSWSTRSYKHQFYRH